MGFSRLVWRHSLRIFSLGRVVKQPRRGSVVRAAGAAVSLLLAAPLVGQEPVTWIRGGHLFDVHRGAMIPNPGIVIVGGRILSLGEPDPRLDRSTVREIALATDQYVLPGLVDVHAHYNVSMMEQPRNDELEAMPVLFLANGVTTTFPAGEYDPEGMMALRKRIDRGETPGPRLFNSGPYFGSARPGWNRNMTKEELYAEVDHWAEQGVEGFKAKGIGPDHLRWLIERAHYHGLTVTGHLDSGFRNSVNPRDAILMGIDRIEHFLGGDAFPATQSAYASFPSFRADSPEFREITELFIRSGVVYDATLTAYGYYSDRADGIFAQWADEPRYFREDVRAYYRDHDPRPRLEQFDQIYKAKCPLVKAFHEAGGTLTMGTDHPSAGEFISGFSSHRELAALVKCGIPPADVLRIATLNGARALGAGDRLGSLEPGKFADLFVVRGNPLEDILRTRAVDLVMKGGESWDPAALKRSVEGVLGPRPRTP